MSADRVRHYHGDGFSRSPGRGSDREAVTTTKRVANAPRSRVTVAPRSFLDAGTEVRQGERKLTDYAFPPGGPIVDGSGHQYRRQSRLGTRSVYGALPAAGLQSLVGSERRS